MLNLDGGHLHGIKQKRNITCIIYVTFHRKLTDDGRQSREFPDEDTILHSFNFSPFPLHTLFIPIPTYILKTGTDFLPGELRRLKW